MSQPNPYKVGKRSKQAKHKFHALQKTNLLTTARIRSVPWQKPRPGREEFISRQGVHLIPEAKIEVPNLVTWSGNRFRYANRWVIWEYKKTCWEAVGAAMLAARKQRLEDCPQGFRVVRFTSFRHSPIRDACNLAEGYKFVLDAITWTHEGGWGLLVDDSMDWCEAIYQQVTGPERLGYQGTLIEVWRLDWLRNKVTVKNEKSS